MSSSQSRHCHMRRVRRVDHEPSAGGRVRRVDHEPFAGDRVRRVNHGPSAGGSVCVAVQAKSMSGWARELVGGAKATLLAVGAKSSALAGGGWRVGVLVAKDSVHCCMLHQIESHRIASHRCSRSLREGANSNWEPLARIRAATCDGLLKRVSAESTT